jgi:hypothetical protein
MYLVSLHHIFICSGIQGHSSSTGIGVFKRTRLHALEMLGLASGPRLAFVPAAKSLGRALLTQLPPVAQAAPAEDARTPSHPRPHLSPTSLTLTLAAVTSHPSLSLGKRRFFDRFDLGNGRRKEGASTVRGGKLRRCTHSLSVAYRLHHQYHIALGSNSINDSHDIHRA